MKKEIDSKYVLPEEFKKSKKDVCKHIREASRNKIGENEDIGEETFKGFTDLKTIENLIFHSVLDGEHEYFVVRLYVVKAEVNSFKDKMTNFFSRFYTDLGSNHLAVQISDKMVHWYDCGMVLVQDYEGSKATALFHPQNEDGEDVVAFENTEENRLKICKIIQSYNCEKKYDMKKCNCQHFAKDIFIALDLKSDFSKMEGPVGNYLQFIISKKGRDTKHHAFLVDTKGNIVKENNKELVWETHEKLDDWTNENLEKYQYYSPLIKGFHRAFQMREKFLLKRGKEAYKSTKCNKFGLPTILLTSLNNKQSIDVYELETFTNFKLPQFSGTSGTSGTSGISGNSGGNNN